METEEIPMRDYPFQQVGKFINLFPFRNCSIQGHGRSGAYPGNTVLVVGMHPGWNTGTLPCNGNTYRVGHVQGKTKI